MRVATESGVRAPRRACTSASGMCRPAWTSRPIAPVSNSQRWASQGRLPRSALMMRAWAVSSTAQATAPESWMIQRAWRAEEVG